MNGKKSGIDGSSRHVTSYQVAETAKVSQSTVSLVLSGRANGRVSAANQALVLETARKLGYQPNELARTLRTGNARMLALAVPNVQQPFFGQIFAAAEMRAREDDYSLFLVNTSTDAAWTERLVTMFRSRMIAGCIVYSSDGLSDPKLAEFREKIVFVEAESSDGCDVDLDIPGGMRQVVEHLAGLGHRRIGYLAAAYPKATYRRRFESFTSELKRLGLSHERDWKSEATFDLTTASAKAEALIGHGDFTAMFCDDDLLAAGVYRAARRLEIVIPDQLSVVGFNDIELARILDPELTTVGIPAELVGRTAAQSLLDQIAGRTQGTAPVFVAELTLMVRQSTKAMSR